MMLYGATAEAAAVPNTMATILEVNPPANRKAIITEMSITFSGISATDVPVLVQLVEVTAASAAGTAVTPAPLKDYGGSVGFVAATAAKKLPATEGTVVVLKTYMVPPSSGLVIQYPLGREPEIVGAAAAAKGFAIRANRGAGAVINCDANIEFDE
jgi:hypothetical protein